jgi:hypothetical protein
MRGCAGAIIVAYERIHIEQGTDRRGAPDSVAICDDLLPTVWNQVEATMAYTLGLPLLVIAERGLQSAALLEDKYDWTVQWVDPTPQALTSPGFNGVFTDWKAAVIARPVVASPTAPGPNHTVTNDPSIGQLLAALKPAQAWTAGGAILVALIALASYSYHLGSLLAAPKDTPPPTGPVFAQWVADSSPQSTLGNRVIIRVGEISDLSDSVNVYLGLGGRIDTLHGMKPGQSKGFVFDGRRYLLSVFDIDGGDGRSGSARIQVALDN